MADILWHSSPTMTHHYSVAQIVELHAALEKVKEDAGRWNKSLATLRREQEALALQGDSRGQSTQKSPSKEKRLRGSNL